MCPSPAFSLLVDIDVDSTDEEVVEYLERRRIWDPIPSNVITEVNPFSVDPRNTPEGIWFLYRSEDAHSHNEGSIIKVINGYWQSLDHLQIQTSTPTFGKKTTRDFYVGEAPSRVKTSWRMHEYQAEQVRAQGSNKSQDKNTLCRFFLQDDERSITGVQSEPVNPDGEYLESMLLGFLEQEARDPSSGDAANGSQVVGEGEQLEMEVSSRPPQDLVNGNSLGGTQAGYDFSKEDFLELKDLYEPELSSSSPDNSSLMSMNSDDCFDAEALSREIEIENEGGFNMEEKHVDYRFSVATSFRSNQVVIRPPPSPAFCSNSNLVVSENAALSSSTVKLQSDSDASTSGSSHGSHSGSSQGGSTSSRSASKSVRRMAKLGKRYCCFGSF